MSDWSAQRVSPSIRQVRSSVAESQPEHLVRLALRMRSLHHLKCTGLAASDGRPDDADLLRLACATPFRSTWYARNGRRSAALALTARVAVGAAGGGHRTHRRVAAARGTIYQSHDLGYLYVRKAGPSSHTWTTGITHFLGNARGQWIGLLRHVEFGTHPP